MDYPKDDERQPDDQKTLGEQFGQTVEYSGEGTSSSEETRQSSAEENGVLDDASLEVAAAAESVLHQMDVVTEAPAKRKRSHRYFSIRWKVGASFAILILMTMVIGVVAVARLFTLQNQVNTLTNKNFQVVEQADTLKQDLLSMESDMRDYLDTGSMSSITLDYSLVKGTYGTSMNTLSKLLQGDATSASTFASAKKGFTEYVKYVDSTVNKSGKTSITPLQQENASLMAMNGLNQLIDNYQLATAQSAKKLHNAVEETLIVMAILCAFAILIGLVSGIPATLSAPKNINKVTNRLREIASAGGDLTKRIEGVHSRDEVERLAAATNELLASISALVANIGQHSHTLASNSSELTASTDETARTVNEIAATAGEFAEVSDHAVLALSELNESLVSIQQHSDETAVKADDVASAVMNVSDTTVRGQSLVRDAQHSMQSMQDMTERAHRSVEDLNKSSEEIAQILGAIRNIAEETNLLALNASIEAARAGDAGRGFAIVAQEVRRLAEQSRDSTARINEIIGRNLDLMNQVRSAMDEGLGAVQDGRQAFDRTIEAFTDINNAVQNVVPSTVDIVERTITQKQLIDSGQSGVNRLNELMQQVAAGSQNNAASSEETLATVEEIAASAHELASIAKELQSTVSRFQV